MKKVNLDRIKNYPWDLEFAEKQTYEMCIEAIEEDGLLLKDVRWDELNLTKEQIYNLYLKAVNEDGNALEYIEEQTEEICLIAVKQNGLALEYVKEQTEEICIEAVREYYLSLEFVIEQTPKICMEAVGHDGLAIQFVENQTEEICREALKQDKDAIKYVIDKEKYLEEFNIKYLKEQGNASEVIAIEKDGEWLFTVGCQKDIDLEEFIYRIYNTDGGFDPEKKINTHRKRYLKFLKSFNNSKRAIC
ncbi:DUF4116 domain-containing protein [Clostridioides difficile]